MNLLKPIFLILVTCLLIPLSANAQEIRENETLKKRWAKAVQIKGTHGYHAFLPDEEKGYMKVKHYALSSEYKKVKVMKM